MQQYIDLINSIQSCGTHKPAARENMPGTQSLFGYQFRHDLSKGFPLLTTKKISFKSIAVELLWFLRGDTNIKYLVDNGVNIWNEDAYNFYKKLYAKYKYTINYHVSYEQFIENIKSGNTKCFIQDNLEYKLGDCGFQYGKVWRSWQGELFFEQNKEYHGVRADYHKIDQVAIVLDGLINSPEGRRHMITAIDPAHQNDLALFWCHSLCQFNCRPIDADSRYILYKRKNEDQDLKRVLGNYIYPDVTGHSGFPDDSPEPIGWELSKEDMQFLDDENIPKYYLDCQMYQRSADSFLGVPYNIASYALLTEIFAKICNMIPGEYIHTFGDVHIYDNHKEAIEEQLTRTPKKLPTLIHYKTDDFWKGFDISQFMHLDHNVFGVENYDPLPRIKAELSTGLIK